MNVRRSGVLGVEMKTLSVNGSVRGDTGDSTGLQLDEVGRERQVQRQGRQRAEALAERSVEHAQAMVPLDVLHARVKPSASLSDK